MIWFHERPHDFSYDRNFLSPSTFDWNEEIQMDSRAYPCPRIAANVIPSRTFHFPSTDDIHKLSACHDHSRYSYAHCKL